MSEAQEDHDEDDGNGYGFTLGQHRRILNLLDVAGQLETFSGDEKIALAILIEDHQELHYIAEGRAFWKRARKTVQRFCAQVAALIAALAGLSELWSLVAKWHAH